jgi:hypothetical protein
MTLRLTSTVEFECLPLGECPATVSVSASCASVPKGAKRAPVSLSLVSPWVGGMGNAPSRLFSVMGTLKGFYNSFLTLADGQRKNAVDGDMGGSISVQAAGQMGCRRGPRGPPSPVPHPRAPLPPHFHFHSHPHCRRHLRATFPFLSTTLKVLVRCKEALAPL